MNRRRSNASRSMQISPTPGPWPSSSGPYLAFLPKVAPKNIIEPPNYLVAATHFPAVFVRNASETADGGTKMLHHKLYARAVHPIKSAISLGCSIHALGKTS